MSDTRSPAPLPTSALSALLSGMLYPLRSISFMTTHKLWPRASLAIVVNIFLLLLAITLTLHYAVDWLNDVDSWIRNLSDLSWLQGVLGFIGGLVWWLSVLVVISFNVLLVALLGQVVAGPFLELLSEEIEHLVLDGPAPKTSFLSMLRGFVMGLTDLIWSLGYLLFFHIPVLVLGLIPGLGTLCAPLCSLAFTALVLAHEFITLPLARQMVPYRKRWHSVWRHRWLSLGFGFTTIVILCIPGLNIILLPLATCGGTLIYCDLVTAHALHDDSSHAP
jgi:CysZ protein